MALKFTLLTSEQVDDNGLDVIRQYGRATAATDLAVLLGGKLTEYGHRNIEGDLNCFNWIASAGQDGLTVYNIDNALCVEGGDLRYFSARPVLAPEETAKITPTATKKGIKDIEIVEYGEYPQTVADKQTSQELEKLFRAQSLRKTGKSYTFDATRLDGYMEGFKPYNCPEFEYKGQKYICIHARDADHHHRYLSNGEYLEFPYFENYWVRVEPIEWLKDPSGTWVSKKCLFSGIRFDTRERYDGDFSRAFMKYYLDTYFARDMISSEHQTYMQGLKEKLSEISDLEKVKAAVKPARTPERTDTLARIMRVRKAKALLSKAAQKADREGDQEMLQEIVEMAKPYAARAAAIRNKFNLKRAERRARKNRE